MYLTQSEMSVSDVLIAQYSQKSFLVSWKLIGISLIFDTGRPSPAIFWGKEGVFSVLFPGMSIANVHVTGDGCLKIRWQYYLFVIVTLQQYLCSKYLMTYISVFRQILHIINDIQIYWPIKEQGSEFVFVQWR